MAKGRKVSRPTEGRAWSRIQREATKLGVDLGHYLWFVNTHGQVYSDGQPIIAQVTKIHSTPPPKRPQRVRPKVSRVRFV